jgi:hypothetical protein
MATIFMAGFVRNGCIRVRRSFFVMMFRNIAEASRAARHRRRRKRSGRQRRVQKRDREQTSQRANHPLSIAISAIQDRS